MEAGRINGYILKHKLGEGSVAEVWYAENMQQKPAAIKILHKKFSTEPKLVSMFENEALLLLSLNHPHIRKILSVGTIDNRPCLVMEYLDGEDLAGRLMRGEKFTNDQLAGWWNDLVDALNHLHQKNIIHRDIKPSNLFVTNSGAIKLLDFGVAKIRNFDTLTPQGSPVGTLMFMSPEQVYDIKNLTHKTDIYSLAVSFYSLVTGKAPYNADKISDFEIQENIVRHPLNVAVLPQPWRDLLPQFLHKNAEMRNELVTVEGVKKVNLGETIYITPSATSKPEPVQQPTNLREAAPLKRRSSSSAWFPVLMIVALVVLILNKDKVAAFFKSFSEPQVTETVAKPSSTQKKKPKQSKKQTIQDLPPDTITSQGEDGVVDQVIVNPDPIKKEAELKSFINDYYISRNNCVNLSRFFGDEVLQYYNKSNVSLTTIERECRTYHDKWKFTEAEIEDQSYVFTHNQNGKVYIDFTMMYYIKQNEEDAWIPYKIDVSMVVNENNRIERIVERRIEKM